MTTVGPTSGIRQDVVRVLFMVTIVISHYHNPSLDNSGNNVVSLLQL